MQFSALHGRKTEEKQSFNADEEKGKDPRRVEVLVLKQRYGKSGSNAFSRFIYYPEFSFFEEGDAEIPLDDSGMKKAEENTAEKPKTSGRKRKVV
jgi:hypothetical protein